MEVVQAVQDLKSSISSLDLAMQKQDWEAATRFMQRARAIDPEIVASRFAEAVVVRSLSRRSLFGARSSSSSASFFNDHDIIQTAHLRPPPISTPNSINPAPNSPRNIPHFFPNRLQFRRHEQHQPILQALPYD